MNKRFLLAASLMVLACSCQQTDSKQDQQMQQNQDQMKRQRPSGGCGSCETEKPQSLPKEEAKPSPSVPEVVQQKAQTPAPAKSQ